jgi:acetyltransferase-like isoleucine patch superfamily enzyme
MLTALWKRRERPAPLSRRWCMVWAKRVATLPALLCLHWRAQRLRAGGALIGHLVVIEESRFEGSARNLRIGRAAFIGQDCELILHDKVCIGEYAVINRRVTILTASHSMKDPAWSSYTRPVTIGDHAWVATGAMLLPGVSVGRGAVVGAGAVVRSDVPDFALAMGNPAVITPDARSALLSYDTVHFATPLEAWVGRQHVG